MNATMKNIGRKTEQGFTLPLGESGSQARRGRGRFNFGRLKTLPARSSRPSRREGDVGCVDNSGLFEGDLKPKSQAKTLLAALVWIALSATLVTSATEGRIPPASYSF